MVTQEVLEDAWDNLRAADRFRRQAETLLDERIMAFATRTGPLTERDKEEILHNLRCYGAHFGAAVEALAGRE